MARRAQWINHYYRVDGRLVWVHTIPVEDLRAHEETPTCWCQPTIDFDDGVTFYKHSSLDGRELVERHGVN